MVPFGNIMKYRIYHNEEVLGPFEIRELSARPAAVADMRALLSEGPPEK